jgi:hypothetical protein
MRSTIVTELIDASILLVIQVVTFGKFFPLVGMPQEFIMPLFIGSGLFYILLTRGYSIGMITSYKISSKESELLSYYCTFPAPLWMIFFEQIVFFVIETCIITGPTLCIGLALLRTMVTIPPCNWFLLLIMYIIALIFWGSYFFGSGFIYNFEWFRDSFSIRRLEPLMGFSTLYFPWHAIYKFSPLLGLAVLGNPTTVVVEGMRLAFSTTDTPPFSIWLCIVLAFMWIAYSVWRWKKGIMQQIDPVL